ncbi:efflux RND transporter periplasmic adaptor subunit [Candidatus Contendibacter odensensis]|uniref:Efflux transporter, RND family, MFP subunit n=1 Tax=Candidatus Contendobacter odensis Run_B_J11 TaxID=1400861 RepID=A0A7U7GBT4_9GAMM|nr:efflux RND transporter periplasmic adaptor subunit [Candidatus Contendobacter odensis]MBK8754035.1 efflux RND transporter periplasmic adaptor subunit [Candidatus Competibacteraceae bacterium]CDH45511.1 putative Efflux transporter, RND family, MFP subunit [Candidatus Contendobacter odensis Run_B_J11]
MKPLLAIFAAILLFGAGILLAPLLQPYLAHFNPEAAAPAPAHSTPTATTEKPPVKYRHPMNPTIFSDTPAKDDMGMDYIPVYADSANRDPAGPGFTIAPEIVNHLGVRTAAVERGDLARRIETVGYIDYDERALSHVHLRASGWVENLKVRTLGERVRQGDLLLEVYAPDLVNAQQEYLQSQRGGQEPLKISARDRLLALGVPESQIQQLEKEGRVRQLTAVYARQDGIVSALNIRQGMYVQPETELMTLADASTVWVKVEVFEQQAGWLAVGQKAEVRLPQSPGETWQGTVEYIYPDVDPKTRALRARLRFPNSGERLKFNMFADVVIHATPRSKVLHIPREALIRTGAGQRVIIALGAGRFEARSVEIGIESADQVEIRAGLKEGEQVVTSAQFLLDSESSVHASLQRLTALPKPEIWAVGVINTVVPESRTVNVTHEPIQELNWPAMTMDFPAARNFKLEPLKLGGKVRFRLHQGEDGRYEIDALEPAGAQP